MLKTANDAATEKQKSRRQWLLWSILTCSVLFYILSTSPSGVSSWSEQPVIGRGRVSEGGNECLAAAAAAAAASQHLVKEGDCPGFCFVAVNESQRLLLLFLLPEMCVDLMRTWLLLHLVILRLHSSGGECDERRCLVCARVWECVNMNEGELHGCRVCLCIWKRER